MLDADDRKEIAGIMKAIVEADIGPKFDTIMDGYRSVREQLELINEKLIPMSKFEELEHDVEFLKLAVKHLNQKYKN